MAYLHYCKSRVIYGWPAFCLSWASALARSGADVIAAYCVHQWLFVFWPRRAIPRCLYHRERGIIFATAIRDRVTHVRIISIHTSYTDSALGIQIIVKPIGCLSVIYVTGFFLGYVLPPSPVRPGQSQISTPYFSPI